MNRHVATAGLTLVLMMGTLAFSTAPWPARTPAPAAPTAAGGCVSNWLVSYGGTAPWKVIGQDPDNTPLDQLRFDYGYNSPTHFGHGYIDFNGDALTDVFSVTPRPDGLYQWRYSSAGSGKWTLLNYGSVPLSDLRFGDFDKDQKTDVFVALLENVKYQWYYSSGGVGQFQALAFDIRPIDRLRFGDFNGDGITDVFAAVDQGTYIEWMYSSGGNAAYVVFWPGNTPVSLHPVDNLGFGTFEGTGATDVFDPVSTNTITGAPSWAVFSAAALHWNLPPQFLLPGLAYGDFDGDGATDVFYTTPHVGGGGLQWNYFSRKKNSFTALGHDARSFSELRFGDFNGDGITDVFTTQQVCGAYLPLLQRP